MIKRLLNWLKKPKKSTQDASKLVESILQKLTNTDEQEISCDEVHELIDQFSELKMAGEDVLHLMPLMQALSYEKSIEGEL